MVEDFFFMSKTSKNTMKYAVYYNIVTHDFFMVDFSISAPAIGDIIVHLADLPTIQEAEKTLQTCKKEKVTELFKQKFTLEQALTAKQPNGRIPQMMPLD